MLNFPLYYLNTKYEHLELLIVFYITTMVWWKMELFIVNHGVLDQVGGTVSLHGGAHLFIY